jgi:hypothetical protein
MVLKSGAKIGTKLFYANCFTGFRAHIQFLPLFRQGEVWVPSSSTYINPLKNKKFSFPCNEIRPTASTG